MLNAKLIRGTVAVLMATTASTALAAGDAAVEAGPYTADVAAADQISTNVRVNGPLVPLSYNGTVLASTNLTSNYGRIRAFWGRIRPFDIDTFWSGTNAFAVNEGDMVQFWGRIRPFYGRIRAFWEGTESSMGLTPLWGRIRAFWGEGEYGNLYANDLNQLQANLDQMVADSRTFWDPMIQQQTGGNKTFDGFFNEFVQKMAERHQMTFTADGRIDASQVATWDAEQRAKFIVEWYDGLMSFSGSDHVDHWMKTAKWNPALTEVQGTGSDAVIGLMDSVVTGDADLLQKIAYVGGNGDYSDGHGAAVAGLLVASHDGRGVMGIAPNAKIAAYNPFGADGTASWESVSQGLQALGRNGAKVINLSLGVPGYTLHPEWNNVLKNADVAKAIENAVLVFAAGNDGITQTGSLEWNFTRSSQFIVVGSADPTGKISEFSNRPGDVCLTSNGTCVEKLSDRFILAPGELILVSDDKGGVIRHSGTSFAAPMVAGAIALLHDRWPWLKKFPKETADIILMSATPIEGSSPQETGRGLLNIEASQSPLDFNRLTYYEYADGTSVKKSAGQVLKSGIQESTWEAKGMYFYAFERIGNTQRDFAIPLSSKLINQTLTINGKEERFQNYIYGRMIDWMNSRGSTSGFTNQLSFTAPVANTFGWNMTITAQQPVRSFRSSSEHVSMPMSLRLATPSDRVALHVGQGNGAFALAGHKGFGLTSDYDVYSGGVNPLLGFASGDAFGGLEFALSGKLRLSAGITQRQIRYNESSDRDFEQRYGIKPYEAGAMHVALSYQPTERFQVSASYTRLKEETGLLGVQSYDKADLANGSTSESATVGADMKLGYGFALSASATVSRTKSADAERQNLSIAGGGLIGTAYEVAMTKDGVIGKSDRVRLSVSQPMFIEQGYVNYTYIKVLDRETGEIGPVTERFAISGSKRPYVAELLYGTPFLNGTGELSAFGRAEQRSASMGEEEEYIIGGRVRFDF